MRYGAYLEVDLSKLNRRIGAYKTQQYNRFKAGLLTKEELKLKLIATEEFKRLVRK